MSDIFLQGPRPGFFPEDKSLKKGAGQPFFSMILKSYSLVAYHNASLIN